MSTVVDHPHLTRMLGNDEMWVTLGDFDGLMKAHEETIRARQSDDEANAIALSLHEFVRNHYHLFLVGTFKVREVARGIAAAHHEANDTALFNLTRAFIEHTAALAYQIGILEKAVAEIPKKPDFKNLRHAIERHHDAAKKLYYNRKAAIHINTMIGALGRYDEHARKEYDALCEYVHPNFGSNKLVSSGELGSGHIGSRRTDSAGALSQLQQLTEKYAMLVNEDFARLSTVDFRIGLTQFSTMA